MGKGGVHRQRLQSDRAKVSTTLENMDYTTTARPLLSTLPGLQGLRWANLCCGIICASSAYVSLVPRPDPPEKEGPDTLPSSKLC